MMRAYPPFKLLLSLSLLGLAATSCKKDDDDPKPTTPIGSDKTVIITDGDITTNTAWTNVEPDSTKYDYIVKTEVNVRGGVLTIAPGVRINFQNSDAGIYCSSTGAISAVGTAALPIIFESELRTRGAWPGINFTSTSAVNRLDFCYVRYAGSKDYRSLFGVGKFGVIVEGKARINNTRVESSAESGFFLDWQADVTAFDGNSIRDCPLYPLVSAMRALDRVGANNRFTGSGNNRIAIYDERGTSDNTVQLRNFGLAYEVQGELSMRDVNVTIDAGTSLLFGAGSSLRFETGTLIAAGTLAAPITFRGLAANIGSWHGIEVGTSAANRMEHCVVDGAGGGDLGLFQRGNIVLADRGRLILSNSIVRNSEAWGINKPSNAVLTATNVTYINNTLGNVGP